MPSLPVLTLPFCILFGSARKVHNDLGRKSASVLQMYTNRLDWLSIYSAGRQLVQARVKKFGLLRDATGANLFQKPTTIC